MCWLWHRWVYSAGYNAVDEFRTCSRCEKKQQFIWVDVWSEYRDIYPTALNQLTSGTQQSEDKMKIWEVTTNFIGINNAKHQDRNLYLDSYSMRQGISNQNNLHNATVSELKYEKVVSNHGGALFNTSARNQSKNSITWYEIALVQIQDYNK